MRNMMDNIKLTNKLIKKGFFESVEKYRSRMSDLGYVNIGDITITRYEGSTKLLYFTSKLHGDIKTLEFNLPVDGITFSIKLENSVAKELIHTSKTYQLNALLRYDKNFII